MSVLAALTLGCLVVTADAAVTKPKTHVLAILADGAPPQSG
jgi:hypothetical protein